MNDALVSGIGFLGGGAVFVALGFTRKPLEMNALNPIKTVPVWAARLVYLPIGMVCLGLGLRNLVHLVLK